MTIEELRQKLAENHVDPRLSEYNPTDRSDGLMLVEDADAWHVTGMERGAAVFDYSFRTESEACRCMFAVMVSDPMLRTDYGQVTREQEESWWAQVPDVLRRYGYTEEEIEKWT